MNVSSVQRTVSSPFPKGNIRCSAATHLQPFETDIVESKRTNTHSTGVEMMT